MASYFRLVDESGSYDITVAPPLTLGRSLDEQPFGTVAVNKGVTMLYLGEGKNLSRKHCRIRYDAKVREYRMDIVSKNGLWTKDHGEVKKAEKGQPEISIALRDGLPLNIGLKKMYFQLPIFRSSGTTPKSKKRKTSCTPTAATIAARKKSKASGASASTAAKPAALKLSPPPPPPISAPPADVTGVDISPILAPAAPQHAKPTAKYHVLARDAIAKNPALADGKGIYTIREIADAIAVAHPYFSVSPENMKRLVGGLRRNFGRYTGEFVKQPAKPGQQSKVCYYVWQCDGAGTGAGASGASSSQNSSGAGGSTGGAVGGAVVGAPA